jgi:RNA polymerase sigma factor (sigma-70 family)
MGYRFSTYATYWIRSIVTRGIASSSRNIRIPYGLHEIMIKIKKIMNTYIVVHNGKIPTDKDLAEITGFSLERVKTARECMDMNISLYTPVGGEDSDATLCDTIPDNTNIEDYMIEYQMKDYLNELITMARLTEREEFVIKARNGFYGRTYTLAELGIKYNVTREMIRQIEMKTLEKLKKTAKLKNSLILINQDYRYDSSYDRTSFKYSL